MECCWFRPVGEPFLNLARTESGSNIGCAQKHLQWHSAAMASKLVLLPTLLLALAFVTFCAPSFVFGGRPAPTSSLRSTARAAVPEALELQTSMTTALEVSTPGWWANIVLVVVPCAILIILYLQSEKRKYEIAMGKKWAPAARLRSWVERSCLAEHGTTFCKPERAKVMPKTVSLVGVDAPLPYPCGLCSSIAIMTSYDIIWQLDVHAVCYPRSVWQ